MFLDNGVAVQNKRYRVFKQRLNCEKQNPPFLKQFNACVKQSTTCFSDKDLYVKNKGNYVFR